MYGPRNYVPLTKRIRTIAMDPYEQQLLNVFESYDLDNTGSLDRNALTQLCQTLQLEEQTSELIGALLPDRNKSARATFVEFKDALLAILGHLQNSNKSQRNQNTEVDNNSPEREVSPKLVYGSKRYGRRSRPKLDATPTKLQNDMNYLNKSTNVQRSNSQCETLSKKRKSLNAKVKRCTSFPGSNDYHRPIDQNYQSTICQQSSSGDEQQLQHCMCSEEMLREAWKNLGVGTDGSLNQTELILVCDAIGLRQLANGVLRQLSDKLAVDYNHKISFQELLEILQQDDTWSDLLNPPQLTNKRPTDSIIKTSSCVVTISDDDSANFAKRHISLGPDGSGLISIDLLLDLWETAGISNPKLLLNNLGFTEHIVNVTELAEVLDKEIKTINDLHSNISTTRYDNDQQQQQHQQQVLLLQATVALYQTEIRCAKQILGQVKAEREKLRADVAEGNNRAVLLAHEVDDNHAKMERNVQQQIKVMEQKHSDVLRQVSQQLNADKEHISTLNQTLQEKIDYLESEEIKLRNELKSAQNYANSLELENQTMVLQIGELNNTKQSLSEQVVQLESEKMDGEAALKVEAVVAQLSALHVKNSEIRDRNDEMASEIQCLNREISVLRGLNNRKRDFTNNSVTCKISTNDLNSSLHGRHMDDQSLYQHELLDIQPILQLQHSTTESGFETELEYADSNSSLSNVNGDKNSQLYSKIAYLEEILKHHNIPVPDKINQTKHFVENNDCKHKLFSNTPKKDDTNLLLHKTKSFLANLLTDVKNNKLAANMELDLVEFLKIFETAIKNDEMTKFQDEFKTLKDHCNDLELCIEQLRNEYERCEDYWSAKLEEERNMFEQEQNQNSEKLAELMSKLNEFEAQYTCHDARLPVIDEKDSLEKQYMDLEEEYEGFKRKILKEIEEKNAILSSILAKNVDKIAVSVQTDTAFEKNRILQEKLSNLTKNNVEATNLFSYNEDFSPTTKTASSVDSGLTVNFITSESTTNSVKTKQIEANIPCRPRRTRKYHDRNYLYNKKTEANHQHQQHHQSMNNASQFAAVNQIGNGIEEPTCLVSINTLHSLKVRLHLLEQKNRHLQSVIKQQHWQHERVSQYYWQQHRSEKAEYHYSLKIVQEQLDFQLRVCNEYLDKLSKADFLVKDLFVENAYLMAKVERLQGQCHLLSTHYSNECSSV